jgi:hypothetical protein
MTATEPESWLDANTRFLAAAVAWIRALLQNAAERAVPSPDQPVAPSRAARGPFWGSSPGAPISPPHSRAPVRPEQAYEEMAELEEQLSATPPALAVLAKQLGLSRFEREVLLLCAALELDVSIPGLCARAQGDAGRPYPTFALAMRLFDDPVWDALSPERPLRHWRLLDIAAHEALPLTASPLRIDERAVNFIRGVTHHDERLAPYVTPLAELSDDASASQKAAADLILQRLDDLSDPAGPPPIQLLGPDPVSKQIVADLVCRGLGRSAWRLDGAELPPTPRELDELARLWVRESLLLPIVLYLDVQSDAAQNAQVERLLARTPGLVFLATRRLRPSGERAPITAEIARPRPDEQAAIWQDALGADSAQVAAALAGQFSLNGPAIRDIAAANGPGPTESRLDRLWEACRAGSRPELDNLARRMVPNVGWEDIVLPSSELGLLRQIASQVGQRARVYREWGFAERMTRGLGISVLFAGPPGSGKTLAAEVLAGELKLDLFRIDLSGVVSRWLGETETNLRRLFDAAEEGGAILFFDEADALFGKRTEVKDSHDRYANIEINYLLQRMESFTGLAILATNMKNALDAAFLRRLRFVVDFPFPGVAERKAMWERAFPPQTPVKGLDFDGLAKLNITGGHITVIALNAAFEAAQAGSPVTMAHVLDAARTEMRKIGRPLNEMGLRGVAA